MNPFFIARSHFNRFSLFFNFQNSSMVITKLFGRKQNLSRNLIMCLVFFTSVNMLREMALVILQHFPVIANSVFRFFASLQVFRNIRINNLIKLWRLNPSFIAFPDVRKDLTVEFFFSTSSKHSALALFSNKMW